MTKSLLSGGVIAGAVTGLAVAFLQFFLIQPLVVEAERYETGELVLMGVAQDEPSGSSSDTVPSAHDAHDADDEFSVVVRSGLTVLTLVLTWSGFGLVAGAALATHRALWGPHSISVPALALSGFAAFVLSPSLGLPPELPGMQAAELSDRQMWWVMTAAATVAGLFLSSGVKSWLGRLAGLALMVAPHLLGAPQPPASVPVIPPDLAALYSARALGLSLIGWLALASLLFRLMPEDGREQPTAVAEAVDTR
jgi:cobalt transporter subunit CbtA